MSAPRLHERKLAKDLLAVAGSRTPLEVFRTFVRMWTVELVSRSSGAVYYRARSVGRLMGLDPKVIDRELYWHEQHVTKCNRAELGSRIGSSDEKHRYVVTRAETTRQVWA